MLYVSSLAFFVQHDSLGNCIYSCCTLVQDIVWNSQIFMLFHWLSGQIGYALVPMIARGVMLGADQPVILHMLDIPPAAEALNGVKMELVDAAFPLLKG